MHILKAKVHRRKLSLVHSIVRSSTIIRSIAESPWQYRSDIVSIVAKSPSFDHDAATLLLLRPNMTEKLFTGTLRINQPTNASATLCAILLRSERFRYDLATTNAHARRLCYLGLANLGHASATTLFAFRGQLFEINDIVS